MLDPFHHFIHRSNKQWVKKSIKTENISQKTEHKTQRALQIFNQKKSPNQNNSTSKVKITENDIGRVWRVKNIRENHGNQTWKSLPQLGAFGCNSLLRLVSIPSSEFSSIGSSSNPPSSKATSLSATEKAPLSLKLSPPENPLCFFLSFPLKLSLESSLFLPFLPPQALSGILSIPLLQLLLLKISLTDSEKHSLLQLPETLLH